MSATADAKGVLFAAPDGLVDPAGNQYWDATDACCNFVGAEVDDSGYLMGLVDEIAAKVNVDPARIYFVGHSNGGFMSYRMACDHADRIAAIVSLAGAMHDDVADCEAAEPVSVLQIHGTLDDTILYDGGDNAGNVYPGAAQTVADWAAFNGCDAASTPAGTHDIEATLAGDETTATEHVGCDAGTTAQLWTIEGGGHIPNVADDFSAQVIDWLLLHAK
jgi:polyhydroxybutyrate depolymerase